MMSDLITAAETIRRMAVTFQGIGQVADALEDISGAVEPRLTPCCAPASWPSPP